MSDAEWAVCEPVLPHPAWLAGKGGRPSGYCMRDVVDGIRYLTHNGPVWRALPADYPPAWTVCSWAAKWRADDSTETMHGQLRDRVRQVAGRKPAPTAAIVDSQSVRASEEVAQAGRGYDAGKKINGRKRHIAVDTIGLLLTVLVTAASVQDRDAAKPLLWNLKKTFPKVPPDRFKQALSEPKAKQPRSCCIGGSRQSLIPAVGGEGRWAEIAGQLP